jgi:hypothetical protein
MEFIILDRAESEAVASLHIHGREVMIPADSFIYPLVISESIKTKLDTDQLDMINQSEITFFPETDD